MCRRGPQDRVDLAAARLDAMRTACQQGIRWGQRDEVAWAAYPTYGELLALIEQAQRTSGGSPATCAICGNQPQHPIHPTGHEFMATTTKG